MVDPFANRLPGERVSGHGDDRASDAGEAAVQRLIEENLDYVRALAHQLLRAVHGLVDVEELVSMGNHGLVKAAREYDPLRGAAFRTYAYYRIRGAMFEGVRSLSWSRRSRAALREEEARDAVAEQFAGAADVGESVEAQVAKVEHDFLTAIRRLTVIRVVGEFHEDEQGEQERADPAEHADDLEMRRALKGAIERLPAEDRDLVTSLYFECKSMTDVAREWKVHKSTITRRHADIMESLRRALSGAADEAGG
ncbi:MAG: sigma-70 family RNA polymerase sigma factor [Phycisphaerales bacterium]|nr:sigma-70 family RNA polymerase sigma factor [Phycisphaerales bacterium]